MTSGPRTATPREHLRRSLYLFRKRNVRYPLLESFDSPDTQFPCPRRESSTHALQALNLLNSEFAFGRARALAGRILREAGPESETIGSAGHTRLFSAAQPSAAELDRARKFLTAQAEMIRRQVKAGRTSSQPERPADQADRSGRGRGLGRLSPWRC